MPRDDYAIGVSERGQYRKVLDTDERRFGGSGYNKQGAVESSDQGRHGYPHSIHLNLPPLGALFFSGPA